jgi:cytochrome P450
MFPNSVALPKVQVRLHGESQVGLGGRLPEAADFGRLPYLQAVMNEILRLYPPAYITRETIESCELGGYIIPAGKTIIFSPWVAHRDRRFYDDRDAFRPERRLDGLAQRLPPVPTFRSATDRGGALDKDSRSSKRWW